MKVLVINSGSSTIKYRVIRVGDAATLAHGVLERIGEAESTLRHRRTSSSGPDAESVVKRPAPDHEAGMKLILETVSADGEIRSAGDLCAIGHRVVHGGELFSDPVLIDDTVVATIRDLIPLAPLHNPGNLLGIESTLRLFPSVPQVAVFDTAFHRTIPAPAFHYALPPEWHDAHRVRRYGFHGTSIRHVAREAATYLGKPPSALNLIAFHLGNGASATAIQGGMSVDTSMGMTPLEGLVMGTRSGDLDPGILFYVRREGGLKVDELESLLNHRSGLLGLCGTNDMRDILRRADEGDRQAWLALEVYCYRVRKYLGAYYAVLGRVDALIFTGGIGENAAFVRKRSCEGLERLGIAIDDRRNEAAGDGIREIQSEGSEVKILVVPAGEELEIARQAVEVVRGAGTPSP